jgi:hypothetical protein
MSELVMFDAAGTEKIYYVKGVRVLQTSNRENKLHPTFSFNDEKNLFYREKPLSNSDILSNAAN